LFMWPLRSRRARIREIDPDEIFLDSSNLPSLDDSQFEGRIEHPIGRGALMSVMFVFLIAVVIFIGQAYNLQIVNGKAYAEVSRENRLERAVIFAPRGVIYDRTGEALAWNEAPEAEARPYAARVSGEAPELLATTTATTTLPVATTTDSFPLRRYTVLHGLSHILGFVHYPKQDASGEWWREEYAGVSGAEFTYDAILRGMNGSRIVETDARGIVQRAHIVVQPEEGTDVRLSVDATVQNKLHELLAAHTATYGFQGAAAVIMDVQNGELLALTNVPEYDNAAFAEGNSEVVHTANTDPRSPLLNRAVAGLYTPGSIVKPIFAAAALAEGIIDPAKKILSDGELIIPNPYDSSKPSVFRDWKAHGRVDMRAALAVSSDQYFYAVGGGLATDLGYGYQEGLGIARLDKYARMFGLGEPTGISLLGEAEGVIPTPDWKKEIFGPNEPWRLGDTYITSIGQFGFQITALQAVQYAAAIANGGELHTPRLTLEDAASMFTFGSRTRRVGIPDTYLQIVREGMRAAVSSTWPDRTARALEMAGIDISAKTGTAQLGEHNQYMNSWVIGFWPSENPRYAFAVVLEKAPAGTLSGAAPSMRPFFEWLIVNKPEYANPE
jgi:penicillin-binding protein 2